MSESTATTSGSATTTPLTGRPPASRGRLSRPVAFVAIAAISVSFLAASAAPSPLYVVYQQKWGFSPIMLTVVFAVYVVGLMAALLILGAMSDHVGRRPVLAASIVLEAAALVLFLTAGNVTGLLVARLVQGIATGAATTTLAATLVDLDPPHAPGRAGMVNGITPISGLALGALGCGALVQFAPAPTHLIYALLLGLMVLSALVVAAMPETSALRAGALASLSPRLGVPARLRPDLLALTPIIVASWALGGLYLSLGPSVAADLFGLANHLVGGLVVTLLCGVGAAAVLLLRGRPTGQVLSVGSGLLALGTALTLAGIAAHNVVPAIAGTMVAGIGFGASTLSMFGTLARISTPSERGELFAVGYLIAYFAFSAPAVAAGFATTVVGLRPTTVVYAIAVIVVSIAALVAARRRGRSPAS